MLPWFVQGNADDVPLCITVSSGRLTLLGQWLAGTATFSPYTLQTDDESMSPSLHHGRRRFALEGFIPDVILFSACLFVLLHALSIA